MKSNRLPVNNVISCFQIINRQLDKRSTLQITIIFLLIGIFVISGVSSTHPHPVKLPERDFRYIVNNLKMKYGMNDDDAKNCIFELEHFYTGIKYQIIDSIRNHPQPAITNAWEIHIVHTPMYFNFTYSTFGTYVHYKPIEQDKGQLHVYDKLKRFGIKNMNESVWLLKTLQPQEDYSSPALWNTYYVESNTLSNFNGKVNKFLKSFIEEYNPSSHDFRVLDIAMGQGRNSVWLAQKGYNVTGFDSSMEGIQIAKIQAKQLNLTMLHAYVTMIEEFQFGFEQWDLIVCMYFPIINETNYLRAIEQSLRYKGWLIVEVFHWDGLSNEWLMPIDVVYKTNAIPSLFPNLTIISYEEPIDDSDFGNQPTKLIRYLGQKQCSHVYL